MFFWNPLVFSMIQCMLAIWSLVPLPFLNPAWTSGSSQFTYCWSLACRIWALLESPWGIWNLGFPGGLAGNKSAYNVGDLGLIPGLGRSPGEGNGNPLQYSCPENPMDRGAWQSTVDGGTRVRHNLATKPPHIIVEPETMNTFRSGLCLLHSPYPASRSSCD